MLPPPLPWWSSVKCSYRQEGWYEPDIPPHIVLCPRKFTRNGSYTRYVPKLLSAGAGSGDTKQGDLGILYHPDGQAPCKILFQWDESGCFCLYSPRPYSKFFLLAHLCTNHLSPSPAPHLFIGLGTPGIFHSSMKSRFEEPGATWFFHHIHIAVPNTGETYRMVPVHFKSPGRLPPSKSYGLKHQILASTTVKPVNGLELPESFSHVGCKPT